MSFDISRSTFNPWNDYFGVVMEQGRVQSDADWNEWLAEFRRRIQSGTLDIMGRATYPATTPQAFQITATASPNAVSIGAGRMYVDGLLAENHGSAPGTWDPALAELSGAPQPPPGSNVIDYLQQPYYPNPPPIPADGTSLAYLDVWTRPVTYLQDSNLVDKAIAVDTSGRLQTVWQVRLQTVDSGTTCASSVPYPADSAALLTTNVVPNTASGPCCLTDNTGYTGVASQCYRVEIQNGGLGSDAPGSPGATFKWSRDNASVATSVISIAPGSNSLGSPATMLRVASLGRDQVLGFSPGNWIELLDEAHQLNGVPGEIYQIDGVDVANRTITLTSLLPATSAFGNGTPDSKSFTRIVRWDQSGKVYEKDLTTVWCDLATTGGVIPVPLSDKTLVLENGVTVTFGLSTAGGSFNVGDFWIFAARTADGSVELLTNAPPIGPHHHYAKLAIVSFAPLSYNDCRTIWSPGSEGNCGCCTCTVGDGVTSVGQFTSIQQAINSLLGTGGEVCILPGRYFEHVVLDGLNDVVIRGCGTQTRLASPSLAPSGAPPSDGTTNVASGLASVITIVGSQHIRLTSFCVEAADKEAGVLLDRGIGNEPPPSGAKSKRGTPPIAPPPRADNWDITINDVAITASTLPAIAAFDVALLRIDDNRIAMANVWSAWPAVYASGRELHIDRNWIAVRDALSESPWIPTSITTDLAAGPTGTNIAGPTGTVMAIPIRAPGGIQIGGPSRDVFVLDNEIEGGSHNGITLGSIAILDRNGADTGGRTGVIITVPGDCSTTVTLQIPGSLGSGSTKRWFAAGGPLVDIQIERNRIRDMQLCGIGPVGFFDLATTLEVISIENLSINANHIERTVLGSLEPFGVTRPLFGHGAICVADAENLIVADNVIVDFGSSPGVSGAYGIFVLHAEMADISRNQVRETRDWSLAPSDGTQIVGSDRGGIMVALVTPLALATTGLGGWTTHAAPEYSSPLGKPTYEPGLPALRVEHNVVRAALGDALEVFGFGPFAVVNNALSSGGTVAARGSLSAMTVLILNLGASLEIAGFINGFRNLHNQAVGSVPDMSNSAISASSNGTVLFANNECQLETRADGQRGLTSIMIGSLDHVLFADNVCWVDGRERCAALDALLVAVTVQANSNRFQEALNTVLASGITVGLMNVTSGNLSTYCLFAKAVPTKLVNTQNVSWIGSQICEAFQNQLMAGA